MVQKLLESARADTGIGGVRKLKFEYNLFKCHGNKFNKANGKRISHLRNIS